MPLSEPMVAAVGVPLLHEPPLTLSDSVVVAAVHTVEEPLIAAGPLVTLTVPVIAHPVGNV